MTFNILAAIALAACIIGLLWRARRWFSGGVTAADRKVTFDKRLKQAGRGILGALFGRNISALAKGVILDGLFQIRLFRADRIRWAAHSLIFWGFVPLVVLHALDGTITENLFPGYLPTINPWLCLRNVFGLMVVAGLALAVYRRVREHGRSKATARDASILILVAAIVVSGFLLEGAKIASRADFHRMVEEYEDPSETEDIAALEALWVKEYGLAAPGSGLDFSEEQLELGREVNENSCVFCHSRPRSAVISYPLARLLAPFSRDAKGGLSGPFYWLHVILALAALAWLPYGKLLHALTSPLNCILDRCRLPGDAERQPALARMLALDACTSCGLCSEHCSMGICAGTMKNAYILPSEKLAALNYAPEYQGRDSRGLLEGLTVCTDCLRCTGVCPVGINLEDLWDAVREDLIGRMGSDAFALSPLGLHRSEAFPDVFVADQDRLEEKRKKVFAESGQKEVFDAGVFGGLIPSLADNGDFRLCFNCKTCTSSCPIMDLAGLDELGLAPHQIIHATALGLDELVASSRMLWACLGCYRCQENCPLGGNAVKFGHYEATDGLISAIGTVHLRLEVEDLPESIDSEQAVNEPRPVLASDGLWLTGFILRRHFADDGLQDVHVRDHPLDTAIFVGHEGDVVALLFEELQYAERRHTLRYEEHRP